MSDAAAPAPATPKAKAPKKKAAPKKPADHPTFKVMRLAIGRHCDSNKKKTFSFYRLKTDLLVH